MRWEREGGQVSRDGVRAEVQGEELMLRAERGRGAGGVRLEAGGPGRRLEGLDGSLG